MVDGNEIYYRKRLMEELVAADHATNPQAAAAHRALADIYLSMISEPGTADDDIPIEPIDSGPQIRSLSA